MQGLTYAQLCAMPDDEQIADERIALIIEGDHCTEDEARARVERRQGELFGKYDNAKGNRLRCSLRNPR